ncbi:MAG TPA: nucleotide exchange factor GrpE [Actinophytocola sp.]|uniref:nucleotide exchange factor GrpE n=1 Tax=Actinophytocola sp. TaxID=1872138 RepID=UPI002DB9BE10|nr:nucleotide exchange factor GrpE [Actinophytocola sp.]HEU5474849.1 nucleotide exchange factor GrpE [Actinophytocola sp.]
MADEPGITPVLDEIRTELTGLHEQSRFLNGVIDRLHAENERLRRAEAQSAVQPALRELIKLADDWRSRAVAVGADPAQARLCGEVVEDVTMILERQGVEQFHADAGLEFDRQQHRAVGTQPTADQALDGIIAEPRRPGYRGDGRVVRFAEVVVFKFAAG